MFPEARECAVSQEKLCLRRKDCVESFLGCTIFFHFNFLFHFGRCSCSSLWGEGTEEQIKNCVETNFKMLVKKKVHSGYKKKVEGKVYGRIRVGEGRWQMKLQND